MLNSPACDSAPADEDLCLGLEGVHLTATEPPGMTANAEELDEPDSNSDTSEKEVADVGDNEDDLRGFGIYQALPVNTEAVLLPGAMPESGDDYLALVRAEAATLPNVQTSGIDPQAFEDQRTELVGVSTTAPECPEGARPSRSWIVQTLRQFHDARLYLHRRREEVLLKSSGMQPQLQMPPRRDRTAWLRLMSLDAAPAPAPEQGRPCSGAGAGVATSSTAECEQEEDANSQQPAEGVQPLVRHVARLDQALTMQLLTWMVEDACKQPQWADGAPVARTVLSFCGKQPSRSRECTSGGPAPAPAPAPPPLRGGEFAWLSMGRRVAWLYALLVNLNWPPPMEISADLRRLLRWCEHLRADPDLQRESELLGGANLLIAICGGYFGQSEELAGVAGIEPC